MVDDNDLPKAREREREREHPRMNYTVETCWHVLTAQDWDNKKKQAK